LGCQETKTAGPAFRLANNNPANAEARFHGALIARSTISVKGLSVGEKVKYVTLDTAYHSKAAMMGYVPFCSPNCHAFVQIGMPKEDRQTSENT
jgi:hypothetical protein